MIFTPVEVLYVVLSFCVLWISAAVFWFIWQAAQILRNINVAVDEAREKMNMIERAVTGIRTKFDALTAPAGIIIEGAKQVISYAMEKRAEHKAEAAAAPRKKR